MVLFLLVLAIVMLVSAISARGTPKYSNFWLLNWASSFLQRRAHHFSKRVATAQAMARLAAWLQGKRAMKQGRGLNALNCSVSPLLLSVSSTYIHERIFKNRAVG